MLPTLSALYEEERATTRQFRGIEAFISSQARRKQAEHWLSHGMLQTAEDYYQAAYLLQHGERPEHWAQAHLLARTAVDLGHVQARYQAAAAYDRWLMRQGKPQKYGTNSTRNGVWPYDPHTTDEERAQWDVPPLQELLDRYHRMVQDEATHADLGGLITSVEVLGKHVDILEVPSTPQQMPEYGVPQYEPLPTFVEQPHEFPPHASVWQIGGLYCAKNAEDDILCSWHPCVWQWKPLQSGGASEGPIEQLIGIPQWMSVPDAYWHRVSIAVDATQCWLVGGILPRDTLQALAYSLL